MPVRTLIRTLVVMLGLGTGTWAATLTLSPASTTKQLGETLTIDVIAGDVIDLYAWQLDIQFNPAVLSLIMQIEGPFLAGAGPTLFTPGFVDNAAGSASFIFNSLQGLIPGASGTGTILTLTFKGVGAGTSAIEILNPLLLNGTLDDIQATVHNATAIIRRNGGGQIPEPATVVLGLPLMAILQLRRRSR